MSEQLHALTAVLLGKWATSHRKQGWVGHRAGPDRKSLPSPGFNSECPACSRLLHHLAIPLPVTHSVLVCVWHTVDGKIMRIILHKDLYDTNSSFAFQYIMIQLFICFLSYIKNFKEKCVQLNHIYIFDNISHRFYKLHFIQNFSMNTTHNTFLETACFHFQEY
jgi:hypothetical protein